MLGVVICPSPRMVAVHKAMAAVSQVSWWTAKDKSGPRPSCSPTWLRAFLARKEQWRHNKLTLLSGVKFKNLHFDLSLLAASLPPTWCLLQHSEVYSFI